MLGQSNHVLPGCPGPHDLAYHRQILDEAVRRLRYSSERLSQTVKAIEQCNAQAANILRNLARVEQIVRGNAVCKAVAQQSKCAAFIIQAIREAGHRLTCAMIVEVLNALDYHPDVRTVKRHLRRLITRGQLNNSSRDDPPGYGLA